MLIKMTLPRSLVWAESERTHRIHILNANNSHPKQLTCPIHIHATRCQTSEAVWQPTRSTSDIQERVRRLCPQRISASFCNQPSTLTVGGLGVWKNELNCHNIVLRQLARVHLSGSGTNASSSKASTSPFVTSTASRHRPRLRVPRPQTTTRAVRPGLSSQSAKLLASSISQTDPRSTTSKIDRGALTLGFTRLEGSDGQRRTVRQVVHAPVKQD